MEFQKLQRIIADVLNISEDKITKESAFVDDLKADSLDVFQIITEIEDQFGILIEFPVTYKVIWQDFI